MSSAREGVAVAAGGALGALGRWGVAAALPGSADGWPWATLTVNVTGALVIGLLVARLTLAEAPAWARPFAVTGLLGGWTTYSALALDVHALLTGGAAVEALAYLVATTGLGLLACVAGLRVGEGTFWPVDPAAEGGEE